MLFTEVKRKHCSPKEKKDLHLHFILTNIISKFLMFSSLEWGFPCKTFATILKTSSNCKINCYWWYCMQLLALWCWHCCLIMLMVIKLRPAKTILSSGNFFEVLVSRVTNTYLLQHLFVKKLHHDSWHHNVTVFCPNFQDEIIKQI